MGGLDAGDAIVCHFDSGVTIGNVELVGGQIGSLLRVEVRSLGHMLPSH
jgi:hypothetical protein